MGIKNLTSREIKKEESLACLKPKFIQYWDFEKNTKDPKKIRPTYGASTWWRCKKEHSFPSSPNNVTSREELICDFCNSIKYTHPELILEWNWKKNDKDPEEFSPGSGKKVHWKCKKNDIHEWETTVASRALLKTGCPCCARKKVCPDNNLEFLRPSLAEEWHPEKNRPLLPSEVMPNHNKKVWWLCEYSHPYDATPNNRNYGKGCPYCSGHKVGYGNSLADNFPEIAKEFDKKKNGNITPETIYKSDTTKKIWWRCKNNEDHHWPSIVSSRTRQNTSCTYCSGNKVSADNNFAVNNPDKIKFFDFKKNKGITPYDYTSSSDMEVWWKCKNKHSWKAPFKRISRGGGCGKCSLQTSFPEIRLFCEINSIFEKTKDRHKFKKFEVDILIEDYNIAIEYDGWYFHKNSIDKDLKKNTFLEKMGIKIFRIRQSPLKPITNDDVLAKIKKKDLDKKHINHILLKINQYVSKKDQKKIQGYIGRESYSDEKEFKRRVSYLPLPPLENSLAKKNPELSKQWNKKKNGSLTPKMFEPHSGKIVWWICKKKHEWEASIDKRSNGSGCPCCKNKKVCADNNLLALSPNIAKEWAKDLNGEKTPENTLNGSGYRAWWLCDKGHYFHKKVVERTGKKVKSGERYGGCPWCKGYGKNKIYVPPDIDKIKRELKK